VRFVAATNRDLKQDVALGKFRKDLLFRINAVTILLPPLRERVADIAPLANHFLKQFCQKNGLRQAEISQPALQRLQEHAWPGNVRELKNVIERAAFVHNREALLPEDFVLDELPSSASGGEVPAMLDATMGDPDVTSVIAPRDMSDRGASARSFEISHTVSLSPAEDERQRVLAALASCGGNQTRAAKLLGFSRRTLVNRLREYNLPRPKKPL
jgi:DNA-binding NtrC family response regulator